MPGITIEGFGTGLWISLALTAVNAILERVAYRLKWMKNSTVNVTQRLVKQRGEINLTNIPGILFLEIDGLGEKIFRHALEEGHYAQPQTHGLIRGPIPSLGWETDFTSQTGAMQTGILMGSNEEIPAYRWWDRQELPDCDVWKPARCKGDRNTFKQRAGIAVGRRRFAGEHVFRRRQRKHADLLYTAGFCTGTRAWFLSVSAQPVCDRPSGYPLFSRSHPRMVASLAAEAPQG